MITVTLTKPRHVAAANAAYAATIPVQPEAGDPIPAPYASVIAYVQALLTGWAESWADSTGVDRIGVFEFVQRFETVEFGAAQTLALTDPIAESILANLRAVQHVRLGSDAAIQGIGYLVSAGVLTSERAAVVLHY